MYSYYDCLNPEAPEVERVYGQISRYAIITAMVEPPKGLTLDVYFNGLNAEEVLKYS
jgi:hypothetical protein